MINFPSSPSVNDVYQFNGSVYRWTGSYWAANDLPSGLSDLVELSGDTVTGNVDVSTINDLTWPTSDGTAGDGIVTDGAGLLSFGEVSTSQVIGDYTIPNDTRYFDIENLPAEAKVLMFSWTNLVTMDDYLGNHPVILPNKAPITALQQIVSMAILPSSEIVRGNADGLRLETGFADSGTTGQGSVTLLWDESHTTCYVRASMNNEAIQLVYNGWMDIPSITSVSFFSENTYNWSSGSIRVFAAY